MRQRVDALRRRRARDPARRPDQIEVSLPGVENAERAAAAGRQHRPAVLLRLGSERPRPELQDRPTTQVNGGQQAITGLYDAVQPGVLAVRRAQATATTRVRRAALLRVRQGLQAAAQQRPAVGPRGGRGRGPHRRPARAGRGRSRCPEGILVVRDREGEPRAPAEPDRWWVLARQPGALAAPTSRTRSRPSTERGGNAADRHVRVHRQGPRRVPGHHARDRPARRRQRAARRRPRGRLPALRDRARQRARLRAVHQLPREPRRHRRLAPARRSRAASRSSPPRTWRRSSRSARCRSSSS